MARLRFGYFIAPFHRAGTNLTLALQRDLEFAEHLDALGYDEIWYGEHHSADSEIISSPEQARAQVQRLWDQSGGFGCMLQMGHEWANPAATKRSAELFAAEVIPHFQGQAQPTLDAAARASEVRDDLAQTQLQAIDHMTKKYQDEVDSK